MKKSKKVIIWIVLIVCGLTQIVLAGDGKKNAHKKSFSKSSNSISQLIVFGDSNVDMGAADSDSLDSLTSGLINGPPNFEGRNCNGPVVVEYAAQLLGVPLDNYSVSGATTGEINLIRYLVPNAFPLAETTGALNQIAAFEEFLNGKKADRKALYVYWAGSNDLYGATPETTLVSKNVALANIEQSITRLVQLGARKILVANRTPRQDFYGQDNVNGMIFNTALHVKVEELNNSLKADIQVFKAFEYIADMTYNPEFYGFTNTTDLCFDDPVCNSDSEIALGYMLWDAPHKTTRVHEILAEKLVEQISCFRK